MAKRFLLFVGFVLLQMCSFAQTPVWLPISNLIAWYPKSGNFIDSSGNGFNASNFGAIATTDRYNITNKAYAYGISNCNTYAQSTINTNSITNATSISFWFYLNTSVCSNPTILQLHNGCATCVGNFEASWNTSINSLIIKHQLTATNIVLDTVSTMAPGIWYHVTYVNNGINAKFYINGIIHKTQTSLTNFTLGNNLVFGKNSFVSNSSFNGKLDDVAIWSRALTPCEVHTLYESISQPFASLYKIVGSTNTTVAVNNGMPWLIDSTIVVNSSATYATARIAINTNFNSGDILSVSNLPSGVFANYNATNGILTLSGNLTPSNVQAVFRTVSLTTTSSVLLPRYVTFSLGDVYSNANGHFYKLNTSIQDWQNAKLSAQSASYFGMQGYLATITSSSENAFVKNIASPTSSVWIGGSDEYTSINNVLGATLYINQIASEGKFYWVNGPESGLQFSQNNSTPITQPGMYTNWLSGEPNNSGANEHFTQLLTASGQWNDLPMTGNLIPSVIEFGEMGLDSCLIASFTKKVNVIYNTPPTITPSYVVNNCSGSTSQFNIVVKDNETSAQNLSISLSHTNSSLIINNSLTSNGSDTLRTISFTTYNTIVGSDTIIITVSDTSGLSTTAYYPVVVDYIANTNPIIQDTIRACGNNVLVFASPNLGTYQWSSGQTTNSFNAVITNKYTLQITKGACIVKDTVVVGLTKANILQGDTTIICNGDNTSLSTELPICSYIQNTGIPGYQYKGTFNGSYYYMADTPSCWNVAKNNAQNAYPCAYLVCIDDNLEQQFVQNISTKNIWIGYYLDVTNTWKWVNGQTTSYTNWRVGEPNGGSTEPYAHILTDSCVGPNQWNDFKNCAVNSICDSNIYGVLEIKPGNYITQLVAPVTYLWSNGATTSTINVSPSQTTTYWVKVSNGITFCMDTIVVVVKPSPIASIQSINAPIFCQGNSVVMTASTGLNYTYQWFYNNLLIPNALASTYNATQSGTYYVKVNLNGCVRTSNSIATTMLAWTNPIINAIGNTTVCNGDSVLLYSNTNLSFLYQWYRNGVLIPGATFSQYKAYQSGSYKVEISNAANCSLFSNIINVVVALPIVNTIQPNGPIINICKNASFVLTAALTPNVTYQWYQNNVPISGAISNLFSISIPGTYFVKFTSNSGCVKYSDTLIVGNYPVTPPVFQYLAPNLSVGSYMTYQWYLNSQPIAGATTNSIQISQNGVYYVHVKDFNECEYDSSPYILDNLGIAITIENSIKAYPNPTTNKVRIVNVRFKTVLIKNQLGQIIAKQTTNDEIDFSAFSSGLYAVSLYSDEGELVGTIKITKQ
jgi:hypothetical protein